MEFLNNIWIALTTPNAQLIDIISIPLTMLELYLTMELFISLLNIDSTKKQKIIYLAITIPLGLFCNFLVPKPYSNLITLIVAPIAIKFVFNISIMKAILAEFLPVVIITVLETILTRFLLVSFNINYLGCANIPLFRFGTTTCIYVILFVICQISKKKNINITVFDNINKHSKLILLSNMIVALVVIFMQMYLIGYYNDTLPSFIVFLNILFLVAYFVINFYSIAKTMSLQKTQVDLEQEKQYNKTLQILHDNLRAFKHDFANIISGIGGYVETDDMEGLKKYYKQLLQDCNQVNNLGSLNPDSINSPAVYAVLANKYYKADSAGIKISLDSFIDFNHLYMGIYEFTRILGILMDNAIEAASECDNKYIHVEIRNDDSRNRQLLIVENTFKNKDINIDKIYEKGYSTKPHNTGLGLWEVEKILKKNKNVTRFTSKDGDLFKQQIEIYKE